MPGVDPETRERLELRGRATFGGFLLAALQGRLPGGTPKRSTRRGRCRPRNRRAETRENSRRDPGALKGEGWRRRPR